MKYHLRKPSRTVLSGTRIVFGLGSIVPAFSYEPTQFTGTGTVQGNDGSMTTPCGGDAAPYSGRYEHSEETMRAVRNPSQAEPAENKNRGSSQIRARWDPTPVTKRATVKDGGQAGVRMEK